tara:strand:+ start:22 stop:360 length:339 start_codon:yes stop_codon:yes gene_type:complete
MAYFGKNAVWACGCFNGTDTSSIYDSHNVSSITDHATGTFRVNFTNNAPNTNYVPVGLSQRKSGNSDIRHFGFDHASSYNHYNVNGFDFRYFHYTNVSAAETTLCPFLVLEN